MIISTNDIENSLITPEMTSPSKLKDRKRREVGVKDLVLYCLILTVCIIVVDLTTGDYKEQTKHILRTVIDNSVLKFLARALIALTLVIIIIANAVTVYRNRNV